MAGAFAAQLAVCIANLRAMEDMSNNLTEARINTHLPAWVDTGLIYEGRETPNHIYCI